MDDKQYEEHFEEVIVDGGKYVVPKTDTMLKVMVELREGGLVESMFFYDEKKDLKEAFALSDEGIVQAIRLKTKSKASDNINYAKGDGE